MKSRLLSDSMLCRFSLRDVLCLTALVAVLVGSTTAESVVGVLLAVCLWAAAGAWWGLSACDHPVAGGAFAAMTSVAGVIFTAWTNYLSTYFLSGRPTGYFDEDGFAIEVIVYPICYFVFYAPIALLFGAGVGLGIWVIGDHLPRAANRPCIDDLPL